MLPLRRAALRALTSRPSTSSLLSTSTRTLVTYPSQARRSRQSWGLSAFQRRFASDEANPSESTATEEPTESEQRAAAEVSAEAAPESEPVVEASEKSLPESAPEPQDANQSATSTLSSATSKVADAAAGAASAVAGAFNATTGAAKQAAETVVSPTSGLAGAVQENKMLYVGNLFFEATEDDLRNFFADFGAIEQVRLVFDHRGLSKGFGYVTFANQADANRALESRNQEVFQGRRITVQYHRQRADRPTTPMRSNAPSKTLFIGNMSFEMSDKDLNDLFREIRNVLDVRVAIDRRSGQPRGFAHADFIDVASATRAKEILGQKEIYGRALRVDYTHSSVERRDAPDRRNTSGRR